MTDEKTVGIFLHSMFSFPGWGQREMGYAGWKCLIDWARAEGFNTSTLFLLPQRRSEDPAWTYPERRRLYHSLLAPRPQFDPGDIYFPDDPLMSTPEARRNHEIHQEIVRYAAQAGLQPFVGVMMTLGAPTFAADHPEYQAIHASDFCEEGLALSPMYPEAVDHLLKLWSTVVDAYPEAPGFYLWHSDPGVGDAVECLKSPEKFVEFIRLFYDMIRKKRPDAAIMLSGWGLEDEIIPLAAGLLPKDIIITEPPKIHCMVRSEEKHLNRVTLWRNAGFRVQQWTEIQENPTVMLPAAYPKRIERTIRTAQQAGVRDFWAASSFYTFVFTLNHHLVSELARFPEKNADEITRGFLDSFFGPAALPHALDYVRHLEEVWTLFYSPSQSQAGFNWPWHMVFAAGLFPHKLMKNPIPSQVTADIDATVLAAQKALAAAQQMAPKTWAHRPIETNIARVSSELLLHRARFRKAKLPVLDAIRTGDLKSAVERFRELTHLSGLMIETAASAPNTHLLNTHWAKLHLLPEKLDAVKVHLPELVQRKEIRGVFMV